MHYKCSDSHSSSDVMASRQKKLYMYVLHADASSYGLGVVLLQMHD